MFYLVDWGNGLIGGFDEDFVQLFNTKEEWIIGDLKIYGIKTVTIVTPDEFDALRGHKKENL